MQLEAAQAAAAAKLLPFVLYSLGVIALFFVFRRSLVRRAASDSSDAYCLRTRAYEAQREIEAISALDWLTRHRAALHLQRGVALSTPQREALKRIALRQQRRVAG